MVRARTPLSRGFDFIRDGSGWLYAAHSSAHVVPIRGQSPLMQSEREGLRADEEGCTQNTRMVRHGLQAARHTFYFASDIPRNRKSALGHQLRRICLYITLCRLQQVMTLCVNPRYTLYSPTHWLRMSRRIPSLIQCFRRTRGWLRDRTDHSTRCNLRASA